MSAVESSCDFDLLVNFSVYAFLCLSCERPFLRLSSECPFLRLAGEGHFFPRLHNYLSGFARVIDANIGNRHGRRKTNLIRWSVGWNLVIKKSSGIRNAWCRPMSV